MDSEIFCVICGASFDLEHHVYNIDPAKTEYQWLYDARLLSAQSALYTAKLTRDHDIPNNTSCSDDVFLSESIRWTSMDSDFFRISDSIYRVLAEDEDGDAVFPLHDACIQIACRVLEAAPTHKAEPKQLSTLARLYEKLRVKLRRRGSEIRRPRDILGLATECDTHGPKSVLALDELGWWGDAHEKFLTDPVKIPELVPFAVELLETSPPRQDYCTGGPNPSKMTDGLEALPVELLDQVADLLSLDAFVHLHRASKTLALKLPMGRRFWRKRLVDGQILPHLWDLDPTALRPSSSNSSTDCISLEDHWNWSALVEVLGKKQFPEYHRDLRLEGLPPGLWNRCRIWKIIEDLRDETHLEPRTTP